MRVFPVRVFPCVRTGSMRAPTNGAPTNGDKRALGIRAEMLPVLTHQQTETSVRVFPVRVFPACALEACVRVFPVNGT